MKFKFKLDTVLKVKTRIEDLRKRDLREAEYARENAAKELAERRREVEMAIISCRETLQQRFDPQLAQDYYKFINWLEKLVNMAMAELARRETEVRQARERLVEAAKEKKILEKLKEKAYVAFQAEELQVEIKFLDEMGTGQFMRHAAGENAVAPGGFPEENFTPDLIKPHGGRVRIRNR